MSGLEWFSVGLFAIGGVAVVASLFAPFVIAGRESRREQGDMGPEYEINRNPPLHEPPADYVFRVPPYMVDRNDEHTGPIDPDMTGAIPVKELLGPEPTTYVSNGDKTSREVR
jgi:hypothetical protein